MAKERSELSVMVIRSPSSSYNNKGVLIQTERQTDRQTNRQTERLINRQTDKK